MTRERKPSAEAVSAAKKIMDDNNLPQSFLLIADQENCPSVSSSYGTTISFADNANNGNNNANKINKVDNNNNGVDDSIILKKIAATATSTASPATAEFELLDTTAETAANVIELAWELFRRIWQRIIDILSWFFALPWLNLSFKLTYILIYIHTYLAFLTYSVCGRL